MTRLSQTLYRSLLRSCKKHDQYPQAKAALYMPQDDDLSSNADDVLAKVYGSEKGVFYKPNVQFSQVLKETFRQNRASTGKKLNRQVDDGFYFLRLLLKSEQVAKRHNLFTTTTTTWMAAAEKQPQQFGAQLNTAEIKAGTFLIAHPILQGTPFARAVILITEYSAATGATGLIVNMPHMRKRKSDGTKQQVKVSQVLVPTLNSYMFSNLKQAPVRLGGPVSHSFSCLLSNELGKQIKGCVPVSDTVMFGGDLEMLNELVGKEQDKLNQAIFFNGVSTWTQNQLENELERGTWFSINANTQWMFDKNIDKQTIWNGILAELHGEYATFQNFPTRIRYEEDDEEDENNEDDSDE